MNINIEDIKSFLISWDNEHQRIHESYMQLWALHMRTSTMVQLGVEFDRQQVVSQVLDLENQSDFMFSHTKNGLTEAHATSFAILTLRNLGCLASLTNPLGTFTSIIKLCTSNGFESDAFIHETDSRLTLFTLQAVTALSREFQFPIPDEAIHNCTNFLVSCINEDGGAGAMPGSVSHAAQIYCVVCGLKIMNQFHVLSKLQVRSFKMYLLQLQTSLGGFCGRPNKLPDACYSMWSAATLKVLDCEFNLEELLKFLNTCQDGGIADRPGNEPDLFHTHYVCSFLGGMGLLGKQVDLVQDMVIE